MLVQKGYDIIKMIQAGVRCYEVMDYGKGQLMIHFLKDHPTISKKQLFTWIQDIIIQLEQFHRCRTNPYYRFLSPYSILVLNDQKLALLDLKAEANMETVNNWMNKELQQKFSVEKQFKRHFTTSKIQLDIYSLGKTLQYILAKTVVYPKLSIKEEFTLRKMTERCIKIDSKYQYSSMKQIVNEVMKIQLR